MTIDGLTVAALAAELGEQLPGSRIQKIFHPQPELLTLELWVGEEQRLLIEAGENARVHLTRHLFSHPQQPSAFCMLLRKYLHNGMIFRVSQPGLERILDVHIRHGEEYILRTELLGKHANIILLRNDMILGALKSSVGQRSFRPGEVYQAPPSQSKLDPRTMPQQEFSQRLELSSQDITHALLQTVDGIGPRLAKEIALRAALDPTQPARALPAQQRTALWALARQLFESVSFSPCLYFDGERPYDVAPIPLKLYAHLRCERYPTLSEALDRYLAPSSFAQEQRRLHELVRGHCVRVRRALERVTQDLRRSQDCERLRHEGQLLLAHLSQLRKGMTEIELEDFLDGTRKTIQLDPALDPAENAQQKFERYKKLKRAQEKLAARVAELRQQIEYLEGVAQSLEDAASDADLGEIREELRAAGYLPRAREELAHAQALGPREFVIRGYRVWVGRSSRQNDELVRRAAREDYWLHARDRPGSHVIIKNPAQREIPQEVLEQAAQLAAYYSKGRDAKKVPVSYTRVKYLRKAGRPGLVLMTQEEGTLMVAPKGDV